MTALYPECVFNQGTSYMNDGALLSWEGRGAYRQHTPTSPSSVFAGPRSQECLGSITGKLHVKQDSKS